MNKYIMRGQPAIVVSYLTKKEKCAAWHSVNFTSIFRSQAG